MTRILSLSIFCTLALLSCGAPRVPAYPGELQSPERFEEDFLLRQQVVFQRGDVEHSLQTALQRRGDRLTLIGLTPFGTRAFVLEQQGQEVSFTSHLPEGDLPFPPTYILFDIQRTLLPVLDGRSLGDGEHRMTLDAEEVTEVWEERRLQERRYRRRAGDPPGELVINYLDGGLSPGSAPGGIEIDNGWLGYRLTLTTLGYQRLEP